MAAGKIDTNLLRGIAAKLNILALVNKSLVDKELLTVTYVAD